MSALNITTHRILPKTGWIVSGLTFLLAMTQVPLWGSMPMFPMWPAPVAAAGMALCVGILWTFIAAMVHTRGGTRALLPDRTAALEAPRVISVKRIIWRTAMLTGLIALMELSSIAEWLTWIWGARDLETMLIAVRTYLWSDLGADVLISLGLVFGAELLWRMCCDRLAVRRGPRPTT